MFRLGYNPITWNNKQQPIVAMNYAEVEYRSLGKGSKEFKWLKKLTIELGISKKAEATKNWCDNMRSLKIAKNPILHACAKHVELHYHYVREQIELGHIDLADVSSNDQLADMFTKPLGKMKFEQLRAKLVVSMSSLQRLKEQ